VDLEKLGEIQIVLDCDVIQADGGTRTASITGAYVALSLAVQHLLRIGAVKENPIIDSVAAVSCGLYKDTPVLDLDYAEDSNAGADANFVMTGKGGLVEIQGTAEERAFSEEQFMALMSLARKGIGDLTKLQEEILAA
jgi:ribonuclease PH